MENTLRIINAYRNQNCFQGVKRDSVSRIILYQSIFFVNLKFGRDAFQILGAIEIPALLGYEVSTSGFSETPLIRQVML